MAGTGEKMVKNGGNSQCNTDIYIYIYYVSIRNIQRQRERHTTQSRKNLDHY